MLLLVLTAIAVGAPLLATDLPWIARDDGGLSFPAFRALLSSAPARTADGGERPLLAAPMVMHRRRATPAVGRNRCVKSRPVRDMSISSFANSDNPLHEFAGESRFSFTMPPPRRRATGG